MFDTSPVLDCAGRPLRLDRPRVMGIVNVTPDSFSDGGRHFSTDAAIAHALALVEQGADLLDVGGESTRPGAVQVSVQEEIDRVVPVIEAVSAKIVHYLELCRGLEICESGINFLFLSQRGRRISRSEVYRVVHTMLRGAGVQGKSSPHVLRHTFATHLLNSGADIRMIQELLGHTSLGATQVYTHNSIEQLKQVYNKAHPRADNIKK